MTCADIANDDRWSQDWRELCVAHHVLACYSAPVLDVDSLPLGSLMLCFDEARTPTDWEYQLAEFGTHVDSIVFERDRSNLALRQSEAKYRTLFEAIDQGFCICEMLFDESGEPADYRFLEVNLAFERLTGLEQATGKTARELVPNLEAFWFETYGKVTLTGKPIRFEHQSIVMNRWFDVNAFRIGEPQSHQFAILFTNITEHKQAESAIREGEERLKLAVEGGRMVAWEWNPFQNTIITTSNFPEIYGLESIQTAEQGFALVHSEDRSQHQMIVENAVATGSNYQSEFRFVRPDNGAIVWLEERGQAILDGEGNLQKLIGVTIDITDRKQAEIALQQREAELRLVTNALPVLISFIDSEQRYRFNNQEYEEWFGHSATEVYGKLISEVLGEAAYATIRPYVEQVLAGEQVTFESEVPYQNGGTRYVEATYVPWFNRPGVVEGVVALVSDVSDRKRAEAERAALLTQAQAAREAVEAANRTAENLATPLSNLQILVVDDDRDTREFQAFLLEQSGAKVTAVASGLESLQVLEQFISDVLVSDVGMAEMDGYMLIQQIRSREASQSNSCPPAPGRTIPAFSKAVLPAIALTAYARDFDQQKALEVGFQAHLTKPVEPEVLVRTIVKLLQENSDRLKRVEQQKSDVKHNIL